MPVYKTYRLTPNNVASETLPEDRLFNTSGSASWFAPLTNPYLGNLVGYSITAPASVGSYSVEFTELADGEEIIWTIQLEVVAVLYSEFNNCCGDRNIAWYNIQGGWQNYIFSGIKTFQVEIGDSKQFKTSECVQKHSEITGVYDGELISSGDIPQEHVNALDGLRYAIQVFLYNDETEAWDIPILLDVNSFTKFRSRDKFFEVRIKFIYAEEILVQTQ